MKPRLIFYLIAVILVLIFHQDGQAQDTPYTQKYPASLDSAASLGEVADNARTTLTAALSSGATTMTVGSTSAFPATGAVTIDGREIVFYTGKTATTFTGLSRGQSGTAALTHSSGVNVEMRIIAVQHNILSSVTRALQLKIGTVDSTPNTDRILLGTAAGQTQWVIHTLDRLQDVSTTGAASGNVLGFNGTTWGPVTGGGTVTSVGLSMPSLFSVSGSPITGSGTFTVTLQSQAQNLFIASPDGGAGVPGARAIVLTDLPDIPLTSKTSGNYVASVATGGPLTGGAAGSEGAVISLNCPTCVTSVSGTTNEIASTGGTTPVLSIPSTFDLSGKTETMPVKSGTTPPGTCTALKALFIDTDATAGQQLFICNSAGNGWVLIGDGGGAGGGITSLGGQTGATQTFSKTDDTNITLTISSATNDHNFALGFTGTLAKARQNAATVYNDAANTWSTGAQSFAAATSLTVPTAAGAGPTVNGQIAYDSTANTLEFGENTTNRIIATRDATETLTNKTLTTPTIADLTNAVHNHQNNAGGGALNAAAIATGTIADARLDSDLAALAANATNGLWVRTASGTGSARSIAAPAAGITVTNPDGVNGNPTLGLANDLNAFEALSGTGIVARTATDAVTTRSVAAGSANISVSNGDGVSGNPTIDIGANVLTNASTHTLTNKTLDAEATGNVITASSKLWFDAAGVSAGTAASAWDLPSSNAPSAASIAGTNTLQAVLDFADGSTDLTAQRTFRLPADWSGNTDVVFKWLTSATSGNVVWGISTACVADGETNDPAFNGYNDLTDAAKGTANQTNDAAATSITTTGCAAGELLHIRIARRLSQAGDTLAATARLLGVELTIRRAQ